MSRRRPEPRPSTSKENPEQLLMSMTSEGAGDNSAKQSHRRRQERTGLVASAGDQEEIPVLNEDDLIQVEELVEIVESGTQNTQDDIQKFLSGEITFAELTKRMDADDQLPEEEPDDPNASEGEVITKSKGRRSKLDEIAEGILGTAELSFARGNHADAMKMVEEVVRENPLAHEPYLTLGDFYEQLSEDSRALQYYHIAALLCPTDGENWRNVAQKHYDQGFIKRAINCYDKAIRFIPAGRDNIECRMERAKIIEDEATKEGKDLGKAIESYVKVLELLEESDGKFAMDLAAKIARLYFENKNCSAGIKVLEDAFTKFESSIVSENVNMYLELLLEEKRYPSALMAFKKYCGIKIKYKKSRQTREVSDEGDISTGVPDLEVTQTYDMPIDLVSKLIVCLVNMKCLKSVDFLEGKILVESAENTGDLYLDVAEAHMGQDDFETAIKFLKHLVSTMLFGQDAAVWLRLSRSYAKVSDIKEAIRSYYKVIELEPNLFDARLELAEILVKKGRIEEAATVSSPVAGQPVNLNLLLVRTRLLYDQKKWADFIDAAALFLSSDMVYITHEKELSCMISSVSNRTRIDNLRDVHRDLGIDPSQQQRHTFVGEDPTPDEYFEVLVRLCHVLYEKKVDHERLLQVAFSSYTCMSLADKEDSLDFLTLMILYLTENKEWTYRHFKSISGRMTMNNQVWNIFCPIVNRFFSDLRHNRFCLRLMMRHPDLLPVAYYNGHNALMSGSYKHALAEYVTIHQQRPLDPFPVFMICLSYAHIASQKFISSRNSALLQLCAFLDKYITLRGECQETYYNAGRIFHQVGLLHHAVHFYRKSLEVGISLTSEKDRDKFDLSREIGYNLSLLYESCGSLELSFYYRNRYCIA